MNARRHFAFCLACVLSIAACLSAQSAIAGGPAHSAVTPVPRDGNWMSRHEKINDVAKQGNIDLIFLGDSITEGWSNNAVWQKYFAPLHAANMGIGGDRTQHVLWRLDHGNIDGLDPKLVVLMIGTNNSNGTDNTAEEIADGIKAIVAKLREKLPKTKVLILAIFPRGESPNPQREKNAEASRLASEVADGKMVYFLDIGPKFLDADGKLSKDIMPDYLHLSVPGYQIWAETIEPTVKRLMAPSG